MARGSAGGRGSSGSSQRRSSSSCIGVITGQTQSVGAADDSVTVTLTDRDVLNCPICLQYLTVPVYQCENGHILCSPCCLKLANKCPYCFLQSGRIRCRAIEKVLESLKVPCRNKKYGCKARITCNAILTHEKKSCLCAPCSCPIRGCMFVGSSIQLETHCRSDHSNLIKPFSFDVMLVKYVQLHEDYIVLQEHNEGKLFVLHNQSDPGGNAFYVTRIGPIYSKKGLSFDLIWRDENSSLILQSPTRIVQGLVSGSLPKKFLMLPKSAFFGASNDVKLELCIWKWKGLNRPASV